MVVYNKTMRLSWFIFFIDVLVVVLLIMVLTKKDGLPDHQPPDPEQATRQSVRRMWGDHAWWSRNYIIATINDSPDTPVAAQAVLENQSRIGTTLRSKILTRLLKEHAQRGIKLIESTKAGRGISEARQDWTENAQELAQFLSRHASPDVNWSDLMQRHMDTTESEVRARMQKDWQSDLGIFRKMEGDIQHTADLVASTWKFHTDAK